MFCVNQVQKIIARLFCKLLRSKMASSWPDKDVFRLIQVRSEKGIQEQLEGAR